MKTPAISVIIPVYNGEKYIEACIRNLSKQSLEEIEIIVVNDGSTDSTLARLKEICDPRVIVITQKNAGAGLARNRGISCSSGEYLAFLDADDEFADAETLSFLYRKAKENKADVCGGSLANTSRSNPQSDKSFFEEEGFIDFVDYQFDYGFQRFIYRRNFLIENNITFPPYRVYEDPVFFLRTMASATRFYAVPDAVYAYSGSHQTGLDCQKTISYLKGLKDNLLLSSQNGYSKLHALSFERLSGTASFFAEKNLGTQDIELFKAMVDANSAIDSHLLAQEGINLQEPYFIPAMNTVWRASSRYMRLRKMLSVLKFLDK